MYLNNPCWLYVQGIYAYFKSNTSRWHQRAVFYNNTAELGITTQLAFRVMRHKATNPCLVMKTAKSNISVILLSVINYTEWIIVGSIKFNICNEKKLWKCVFSIFVTNASFKSEFKCKAYNHKKIIVKLFLIKLVQLHMRHQQPTVYKVELPLVVTNVEWSGLVQTLIYSH